MKNSQKWLLILITVIPAIILTVFFLLSGISIKELPWWTIGIPVLILITPFAFLFAQKMYEVPLQKKKKRLLLGSCGYIVFQAIILGLYYFYTNNPFFWLLLVQALTPIPFMFFGNFRLFFSKANEYADSDNQSN